ncbi:GNAT family N-acetyltransferase [Kribbella sp. NBC_00382]|uniref:GNAT family N-acetyltransferase n=1 Tax=Kribbella sp. NBC_00382 TaxID=2975967 RepID=UPI002E201875
MDELVRRWAHGWTLCRGLAAPLDRPAALEVTLGLPGRDREVFTLTDNAETVNDLAITTAKGENPGEGTREGEVVWLTVTTNQPQATAAVLEQAGLKLLDEPCLLMTIDLTEHPDKAAPPEYRLETSSDGPLEYAKVIDTQGNVAARGMAAIVGQDAVLHDIHTDPAHRRRGLGSVVMSMLSRRATDRGAATGLLMATTDGGYLYTNLGWSTEATMITAVSG